SFSFAPRPAAPAPVAEETIEPEVREVPVAAAEPEAAPVPEDRDPAPALSLNDTAEAQVAAEEEPMELSQVAAPYDDTADELVLGEAEVQAAPPVPEAANLDPAPAQTPEPPARASVGGGTLFERMSRLSRGGAAPEADEGSKD